MNKTIAAYLQWTDQSNTVNYFYPDLVVSENWTEDATATEHPVEQGSNIIDHVRVELVKCELTIFASNEPIGANNFQDPGQPLPTVLDIAAAQTLGTYPQPPVIADVWHNNLALKGALLAAGGISGQLIGGKVGNAIGTVGGAALGTLIQGEDIPTPIGINAGTPPPAPVMATANVISFPEGSLDFVQQTIQLIANLKQTAQIIQVVGSKQTQATMIIEHYSYTREEDTGTGALITLGFKEVRFVQTQQVSAPLPSVPRAATPIKKGDQNPSEGTPAQQVSVAAQLGKGGIGVVKKIGAALGF